MMIKLASLFLRILAIFLCISVFHSLKAKENIPSDKALRYMQVLSRKPTPGYVFNRFLQTWLETSDYDELANFLKEKHITSSNNNYLTLLALLREEEGKTNEAIALFQKLVALNHQINESRFYLARLLFQEGDYKKAIGILEKINRTSKLSIQSKSERLRALCYLKTAKIETALDIWRKLIKKNDNPKLAEELLDILIAEGLHDEALNICSNLLEKCDDSYRSVTLKIRLGDLYRLKNDFDRALKTYSELLDKIAKDSWLEKEVLGKIEFDFLAKDDINGLLKFYRDLPKKHQQRPELLKRRAFLLQENGESKEALSIMKDLLKLAPLDRQNKEKYLDLLLRIGDYEEALKLLDTLIARFPNDAELIIKRIEILHKAGKSNECLGLARKYIQKLESTEYGFIRAGKLLNSIGLEKEASKIFNEFVLRFPENPDAREVRAKHRLSIGDKKGARDDYSHLASNVKDLTVFIRAFKKLLSLESLEKTENILRARESAFTNNFLFQELSFNSTCASGKYSEALAQAKKMLASSKSTLELTKSIANLIFAADKTGEFQKFYTQLSGKSNLSENESCLLAELMNRSNETKVLSFLKEKSNLYPRSIKIRNLLLRYYQRRDSWDKMISILNEMITLAPDKKNYYLRKLIDICRKGEKYEEALRWTLKLRKSIPGSAAPLLLEAKIHEENGCESKAIDTIKQASRKFPKNQDLKRYLIRSLLALGDREEAMRIFWRWLNESILVKEKLKILKELLRSVSWDNETLANMILKLEKRHQRNPNALFPILALAEIHRVNGDLEAQRKFLTVAASIKKDDISLLSSLAKIEEENGRYDNALQILLRAAKLDNSVAIQKQIASFHFNNGDEEKGFLLLKKIAGGNKMSASSVEDIALLLLDKSLDEKASEFITPFLRRFPENYRLRFIFALIQEEIGNHTEAFNSYLKCLALDKEIPGEESKIINSGAIPKVYKVIFGANPPSEIRNMLLIQSILGNRHSNFFSTNSPTSLKRTNSGRHLRIPRALRDVEAFVIPRLSRMPNLTNTQGKIESLIHSLSAKGVNYPEIKLSLNSASIFNKNYWLKQHRSYPDDMTITAMWGMSLISGVSDKAQIDEAYLALRKKHPRLALNIVLNSLSKKSPPYDENRIRELISIFNKMKQSNPSVFIYRLCEFTLTKPGISKELREFILNAVTDIYLNKMKKTPVLPEYFTYLILMLMQHNDYEKAVDLMTEENKRALSKFQTSSSFSPRHQYLFPAPLRYPPQIINAVPESIARVFSSMNSRIPLRKQIPKTFASEKLWSQATKIKDPSLKLFLANKCAKNEESRKIVDDILKNREKVDLRALLSAAAWLGEYKDIDSTLPLLKLILQRSANKNTLKQINGSIIAYCAILHKKRPETIALAKAAANRLISYRLTDRERAGIANSLVRMELKKESRKFLESQSGKTSKLSRAKSPSKKTSVQIISELFKQGNNKAAFALTGREFRKIAKKEINAPFTSPTGNLNSQNLHILLNLLRKNNQNQEFLDTLKSKSFSGKAIANKIEYAFACESFSKISTAIDLYRRILKQVPSKAEIHLRLALLLLDVDKHEAFKHFRIAVMKNPVAVGEYILRLWNSPGFTPRRIALASLFPILANAIAKTEQTQAHFLHNAFFKLENLSSTQGGRGGHLLDPKTSKHHPFISKQGIALWRKIYLDFCDQCLKIPSFARSALGRKQLALAAAGISDLNLRKQAMWVIQNSSLENNVHWKSVYVNHQTFFPRTAEEILIIEALSTGDWNTFIKFANTISHLEFKSQLELCQSVKGFNKSQFQVKLSELSKSFMKSKANFDDIKKEDQKLRALLLITEFLNLQPSFIQSAITLTNHSFQSGLAHPQILSFPLILSPKIGRDGSLEQICSFIDGISKALFPELINRTNAEKAKSSSLNQNSNHLWYFQQILRGISSSTPSSMKKNLVNHYSKLNSNPLHELIKKQFAMKR